MNTMQEYEKFVMWFNDNSRDSLVYGRTAHLPEFQIGFCEPIFERGMIPKNIQYTIVYTGKECDLLNDRTMAVIDKNGIRPAHKIPTYDKLKNAPEHIKKIMEKKQFLLNLLSEWENKFFSEFRLYNQLSEELHVKHEEKPKKKLKI